jgi:hypothetical protein
MRFLATCAVTSLVLTGALSAQLAGITLSNAVDGYVEVPYSPEVVPQSGITVEAWVTYDETTLGTGWRWPTIVRQNTNAGDESYFLRVSAGTSAARTIRWLVDANSTVSVDWNFGPGQLLTWTHLAGTWNGSEARLFVDGVLVGSSVGSGPLDDQGGVLRIGKGSDVATPIEVWNGSIDEVRIWPFARSAAEIQATMYDELASVPGQVSTWNFDNHTFDTSSGRDGTISGAVSFTAPAPGLTAQTFPGTGTGTSTPGCLGAIETTAGSVPRVGNGVFTLVAHRLPPGALTLGLVGTQVLPSALPALGIGVWLDPTSVFGTFPVPVDALGTARLTLPIPATAPPGFVFAVQFGSVDPCGPAGFTASNALGAFLIP